MTSIIKTQVKETEKGTLKIQKILEKDSKVPYYLGTFIPKNSVFSQVILKRYSRFSMSYLEDRI